MEHNKPKPLTMLRGRGVTVLPRPNKHAFWTTPPDQFPWAVGYVFLPIATNRIAREMFGDEWLGIEPTIDRYPPHYNFPVRPEVQRFDKVKRKIAQLAASGVLKTMWRHTDGGDLCAIPPGAWQTERLDDRFCLCQMNLRDPFSRGFAGNGYGYIFVTEASLAEALNELKPSGPKLTASAEVRCKMWLAKKVDEHPGPRPKPKDDFWSEANQEIPGLSRRAFERAWASTVPAEWSKAGPTNRRT